MSAALQWSTQQMQQMSRPRQLYIFRLRTSILVPVHFAEVFDANVQRRFWSQAKDAHANILVNPKFPSNVQKNKKL